jgi:hypothetical protein
VSTPISTRDLADLVELGRFLDARVSDDEGDEQLVKTAAPLLWSEAARALIVLRGFKLPRPQPIRPRGSKAERVYRRWTLGRDPATERTAELALPDAPWSTLGRALTVGYRSDKFHERGDTQDYEHEFGRSVVCYLRQAGARGVVVFRGGSLRVTARGIEG